MTKSGGKVFWAGQLLVLFGFWLLFVFKLELTESVLGALAALLSAFVVAHLRRENFARFAPPAGPLLRLWRLPGLILSDSFQVFGALLRSPSGRHLPGRVKAVPFDPGGQDAGSAAKRALAVAELGVSPNSVVIDLDARRGTLLVHELAPSDVEGTLRKLDLE